MVLLDPNEVPTGAATTCATVWQRLPLQLRRRRRSCSEEGNVAATRMVTVMSEYLSHDISYAHAELFR
jgi:hypothetical protein